MQLAEWQTPGARWWLGLAFVVTFGTLTSSHARQSAGRLECSSLDVVDREGRSRIRLSVDEDGGVRFAVRDKDGTATAAIATVDSTTGIEIRRGEGVARIQVDDQHIMVTLGVDGAKGTEFPAVVISARRGGETVLVSQFPPEEQEGGRRR